MPVEFWPDRFPKMLTVFPDGAAVGQARVQHAKVSKADAMFSAIGAMQHGRGCVREGDEYAQLYVGRTLWMSDTPDERRDHAGVLWRAKGEVLIGGLGLGMVALGCALRPEVTRVTVLEIHPEVAALVELHLWAAMLEQGVDPGKLVVERADVFAWKPPANTRYQCIWMDIWPTLCTDDLAEHGKVKRRFGRYLADGGWFECWGSAYLKRRRAQERREEARMRWWR